MEELDHWDNTGRASVLQYFNRRLTSAPQGFDPVRIVSLATLGRHRSRVKHSCGMVRLPPPLCDTKDIARPGFEPGLTVSETVVLTVTLSGKVVEEIIV